MHFRASGRGIRECLTHDLCDLSDSTERSDSVAPLVIQHSDRAQLANVGLDTKSIISTLFLPDCSGRSAVFSAPDPSPPSPCASFARECSGSAALRRCLPAHVSV